MVHNDTGMPAVEHFSLDIRPGEIVGIAGVSGNGQQELMAAISGEDPRAPAGSITLFADDISRQVEALEAVGVSHLCGLYFVGNTVDEMMDQVRMFARDVIPSFPDRVATAV